MKIKLVSNVLLLGLFGLILGAMLAHLVVKPDSSPAIKLGGLVIQVLIVFWYALTGALLLESEMVKPFTLTLTGITMLAVAMSLNWLILPWLGLSNLPILTWLSLPSLGALLILAELIPAIVFAGIFGSVMLTRI